MGIKTVFSKLCDSYRNCLAILQFYYSPWDHEIVSWLPKPYIYTKWLYKIYTVFDDDVSLCRNNALTQLVQDKLKLVAIFSLWCMWNITPSNKNIFTWIVRRALNGIINRSKTQTQTQINRSKTETLFALQVFRKQNFYC